MLFFQGLARNLEQPETKEWLTITKETLLSDRDRGAETDEENKKLTALLTRLFLEYTQYFLRKTFETS